MIRRCTVLYIGAALVALACGPRPLAPLVPLGVEAVSPDSAAAWAARTVPVHSLFIRLRWRYQDERARYAGRGAARVAPPDSLRFDYAGPLGLGAGAAVVVGDSVVWAEPVEHFRTLVPAVRMLWAALGTVRVPPGGAAFAGLLPAASSPGRVLRFTDGPDTLEYVLADGAVPPTLSAEWRRAGRIVARSRTELTPAGTPGSARIDFPDAPARFEFTVVGVDTVGLIPPALWRTRR